MRTAHRTYFNEKTDQIETLNSILSQGIDVRDCKIDGMSPINLALQSGSMSLLSATVRAGADVQGRDDFGSIPLSYLIALRQDTDFTVRALRHLVGAGADVNGQDGYGVRPIHFARDAAVISELVTLGAEVNVRSTHGYAPIHNLIYDMKGVQESEFGAQYSALAAFLVEGADVNLPLPDRNGSCLTKLCELTSGSWSYRCAKLLLAFGADPNAVNGDGATALSICCEKYHSECIVPFLKCLIENGADVNSHDRGGQSPIFKTQSRKVLRILIDAGANIDHRDARGRTALWFGGLPSEELLSSGADVNIKDNCGRTALHYYLDYGACGGKMPTCVQLLLSHGADPNVKLDRGGSALHLALRDRTRVSGLLCMADWVHAS